MNSDVILPDAVQSNLDVFESKSFSSNCDIQHGRRIEGQYKKIIR